MEMSKNMNLETVLKFSVIINPWNLMPVEKHCRTQET